MRKIFPVFVLFGAILFLLGQKASLADISLPDDKEYRTLSKDSSEYTEILRLFEQAILSAKKKDLDTLMRFYSENYMNAGHSRWDVKKQWEQIFTHFGSLDMDHRIYEIEVAGNFARVKCGGLLLGEPQTPTAEEGIITAIDSWKFAVHQLIKEDGMWKILGNQVPYDTGQEHHPLF